jgi:hypothetical protein
VTAVPAALLPLLLAAVPQESVPPRAPVAEQHRPAEEPPPPPEGVLAGIAVAESAPAWFLHARYEGPLAEMGESFLPFVLLAQAARLEGPLAARFPAGEEVLSGAEPRADVGLLLDREPARVPAAYRIERVPGGRVVFGQVLGAWGDALAFLPEVRGWAAGEGLEPAGAVWAVYLGTPEEPESLETQLRLPLREGAPGPAPSPAAPGPRR